jgi:predicted Zn-dependent peptidase
VGLATTSGLAHAIHQVAARSFPLSFLDTYPDEVAALTASSVNRAVATHLASADLCRVSAGVVPTA